MRTFTHYSSRGLGVCLCAALLSLAVTAVPAISFAQSSEGDSDPSADPAAADEKAEAESGDGSEEDGKEGAEGEVEPGEEDADQQSDSSKPTPKLALLPTRSVQEQITELVPQRIGEMLRENIASSDRVDLAPNFEDVHGGEDGTAAGAVSRAREEYTSGVGLANAGKFDEAADKLGSAVESLRGRMAALDDFGVYTDALLKLAWSLWEINHNYDARKSIREYAHLRPDETLDPETYPEKLRELYDSEAKKVAEAGAGELVIRSEPEGAVVRIDGEKKGTTPVTVDDVAFGYHYLIVRGQAGGVETKRLRVRGKGNKQEYDFEFDADVAESEGEGDEEQDSEDDPESRDELPAFYTSLLASIESGEFGRDLEPYLEELASRTGVDHIAWVVMVREEGEYVAAPFVYRDEDGMFVQGDNVRFSLELGNLRAGVRELEEEILENVESMPEERAVASVSLGQPAEDDGGEAVAVEDSSSGETAGAASQSNRGQSVEPPPTPPAPVDGKGSNNTWKYLGIGGAAVLVGGLVAGGFYYFGDRGANEPEGFSATVSW